MTNPNQNVNFPPPTGPPLAPPTPNTHTNPFAQPPTGPAALNPNLTPAVNVAPNPNIVTPPPSPGGTIATKGLFSVLAERKASRASKRAETAGHRLNFYRHIGAIATTGTSSVVEINPTTGSLEHPHARNRKERAIELRVAEKQKNLILAKTTANLERQNSGAYTNPSAGMKLSKHKTRQAQRQIRRDYDKGRITLERRNKALNNSLAKPKPSQFKPRPYQKKMAKNVRVAEKDLRKETIGSLRPLSRKYRRLERKTQKWQQRADSAAVRHQQKRAARSTTIVQPGQIVHF